MDQGQGELWALVEQDLGLELATDRGLATGLEQELDQGLGQAMAQGEAMGLGLEVEQDQGLDMDLVILAESRLCFSDHSN